MAKFSPMGTGVSYKGLTGFSILAIYKAGPCLRPGPNPCRRDQIPEKCKSLDSRRQCRFSILTIHKAGPPGLRTRTTSAQEGSNPGNMQISRFQRWPETESIHLKAFWPCGLPPKCTFEISWKLHSIKRYITRFPPLLFVIYTQIHPTIPLEFPEESSFHGNSSSPTPL